MMISQRYSRNIGAITIAECDALAKKRVAVIGCGGLGGYAIEMLARVGVGHLVLVDPDTFEASNLNRQLFATMTTLGKHKVDVANNRISEINPLIDTKTIRLNMNSENASRIIAGCDCVVDALDSLDARRTLATACENESIPLVTGGVDGWHGQVAVIWPGDGTAEVLFPPDISNDLLATDNLASSLSFAPACVASFQAAETIKVLLNRPQTLKGKVLFIDLATGATETIALE